MTQSSMKSIRPSAVLSAYFRTKPDAALGIPAPPGAENAECHLRPGLLELSGDSPAADESGELIGAKEAIRRVLVLENPALRGQSSITSAVRRITADYARRSGAEPPS